MTKRKSETIEQTTDEQISGILLVDKPRGWTPLQAIQKVKQLTPTMADVKMSYAGRLDPMARGLLILPYGNEVKNQKTLELTKKIYEFEVLFGFATDTFDILGLATSKEPSCDNSNNNPHIMDVQYIESKVKELLPTLAGKQQQSYPPYSSARVNGKPLFQWAKDNQLDKVTIPTIEVEIYDIQLLSSYQLDGKQLWNIINSRISQVTSGDFRQEQILPLWNKLLEGKQSSMYPVLKMVASVSSGTYVRSIANKLGDLLGVGGLAFDIYRTEVTPYHVRDAIQLEDNTKPSSTSNDNNTPVEKTD